MGVNAKFGELFSNVPSLAVPGTGGGRTSRGVHHIDAEGVLLRSDTGSSCSHLAPPSSTPSLHQTESTGRARSDVVGVLVCAHLSAVHGAPYQSAIAT